MGSIESIRWHYHKAKEKHLARDSYEYTDAYVAAEDKSKRVTFSTLQSHFPTLHYELH